MGHNANNLLGLLFTTYKRAEFSNNECRYWFGMDETLYAVGKFFYTVCHKFVLTRLNVCSQVRQWKTQLTTSQSEKFRVL